MAFCTKCGAQLQEGARFCTNCGAKVETPPQWGEQTARETNVPNPPQPQYSKLPQAGTPGFTFQNNGQPKKKKWGWVVGIVLFLLVAAGGLLFVLAMLFGGEEEEDPTLGTYYVESCTVNGIETTTGGEWLALNPKGKVQIHILNETYEGIWSVDGEKFTILQDGDTYTGTLVNDRITITFSGLGFTFLKEGSDAPVAATLPAAPVETISVETAPVETAPVETVPLETVPRESETEPAPQTGFQWEGDWYGWWIIYEATGDLADQRLNYWNCCARIQRNGSTGLLEIWDEETTEGKCNASIEVSFEGDNMVSVSGSFLNAQVHAGEWTAVPGGGDYVIYLKDLQCISGTYVDPENANNTMHCLFYLRPWGMYWDDIAESNVEEEYFTDMMPGNYDWYVKQIESGVTSAPDLIG